MKAPKTFEEGMSRLEDILAKMQSEETTLADSVKLYAEAAGLVEYCSRTLGKVSLQIDEIDGRLAAAEKAQNGLDVERDVEEQT
ncbi:MULTISPECIES: exodeoxyribonuclease VII small subunit [unclassified Faecalibacterium]|uniref:exodeoxyribonuclease VII small subunit n=1 Tax=unclassified Faecalibacterium TaxID=2646395 RepID=UPI001FA8BBAB|nr:MULTISPECIES: exodeoxyribonuclease VII small subunit [unclassified Faecalibacterium]